MRIDWYERTAPGRSRADRLETREDAGFTAVLNSKRLTFGE
jgi:hypothetical protein